MLQHRYNENFKGIKAMSFCKVNISQNIPPIHYINKSESSISGTSKIKSKSVTNKNPTNMTG